MTDIVDCFGVDVDLDLLRSWRAEGVSDHGILGRLHDAGVSLPGSLSAWGMAFGVPLDEARAVVASAPVWAHRKEADDAFQDAFADVFGRIADGELDELPELLGLAADLLPGDARTGAGLSAVDARRYAEQDEWDTALAILSEFDGPPPYWDLLVEAAVHLDLDPSWYRWRLGESLHGVLRAELRLVPGARQDPVPGSGVFRPQWDVGGGDLRVAAVWVESKPDLEPGGTAIVRLRPLVPEGWRHLRPGDVIALREGGTVTGRATII
ncbi:hypothetical protein ACFYOT_19715 [Saccharothrix saharensis]|uniref:hypothetical protein n=1 Tax=Saccharothrix saharensis TaxID=571190 RepID=UPI003698D9CB